MLAEQKWFTVDEAAQYLQVSKRTIYKLCAEGRLVGYRSSPRGHRRFSRRDLDQAMKRDVSESDTEALMVLTAVADPVLAEVWGNDRDAAYDRL